MTNRLLILACLIVLGVAGCTAERGAKAQAQGGLEKPAPLLLGNALDPQAQRALQTPAKTKVVRMDIYQMSVPMGAVSRSDEFWKRVDEHRVDVATYDLLLKNGLRVGVAPNTEWNYFRDVIAQHPSKTDRSTLSGGRSGATEISLKKGIEFENIFHLDDGDLLTGRTFEQCENLLSVTFVPAPRKPGVVRVTVCPMVRGHRKRYYVVNRDDEREIQYVSPERLFDLNLEADVPVDNFLILAPSDLATWPSSLGNTFLIFDGKAEQFEQVLLLVPRLVELDDAVPAKAETPKAK